MSGIIGLPCNEISRFSEANASVAGLRLPLDWAVVNGKDGAYSRMPMMQVRFASIAHSLNFIGKKLLDSPHEWLFLINDDHIYPPDTLLRLLSHNKDFVTGVYLKKQQPFPPIIYQGLENGNPVPRFFKKGESGLIPISACGDGCLLIHRRVLEKIDFPWWTTSNSESPDLITQDLNFCKKVREAGIEMWCDLDARIVHVAVMPLGPLFEDGFEDGRWATVQFCGPDPDQILVFPSASRAEQKGEQ